MVDELHLAWIEDAFADVFSVWGSRDIIKAAKRRLTNTVAATTTGFATSVTAFGSEAGAARRRIQ